MASQQESEKCPRNEDRVIVGSRQSELALIQTRHVISLLKQLYPTKEFEIVKMSTLGDRVLNVSLPKIGEKSLFTKDLEEALENGSVDMVVHSLKDLPTSLPPGMAIGAVLEREDARDALVLREDFKGHTLATLPAGSIIGTSSLRRTAQLSRSYPHLKVVDIRGNLNTRLRKLDCHCTLKGDDSNREANGKETNGNESKSNTVSKLMNIEDIPNYVALILAQAGLVRMGWQHRISQVLPSDEVLYAVGQGALAIECKASNTKILQMLGPLNHGITYCRILSERSFLKTLGGGCSAPVAISTTFKQNTETNYSKSILQITGAVWSLDGKIKIEESMEHTFKPDNEESPSEKETITKHKLISNSENGNGTTNPKRMCQGLEMIEGSEKPVFNRSKCCRQNMSKTIEMFEPTEIENLINKHGKLFYRCPFSDNKGAFCPVAMPIGQDFMAQCPLPEMSKEDFADQLVKLHPRKSTYDINMCPFMSNQTPACEAKTQARKVKEEYDITKEPSASKCPFVKKNLLEDQPATTSTGKHENGVKKAEPETSTSNANDDVPLYCGLTKHFHVPRSVIESCEDLGKNLAESLIKHGALEVMQCAQNYIRSTAAPIVLPQ